MENKDLRDFFAALAMQAEIQKNQVYAYDVARIAYAMADAMLMVRQEKEGDE